MKAINRKRNESNDSEGTKTWYVRNGEWYIQSVESNSDKLENAVYKLDSYPGGLYLEYQSESFSLPEPLYDVSETFINRVIKTWYETTGNLGLILAGVKGTGKTLSAKMLCNTLNLPVIIVPFATSSLASFLDEIEQEVIILFDEFEKMYSNSNNYDEDDDKPTVGLLSLLDGTSTSKFRRMWLLTTNSTYVDKNLVSRPGRIRYFKLFSALPEETVVKIVDDLLLPPLQYLRSDLFTTIGKLEFITVDAVKSLTQEVNIHQQLASELLPDFNLEERLDKYRVIRELLNDDLTVVQPVGDELSTEEFLGIYYPSQMSPSVFKNHNVGDNLYLKRKNQGEIVQVTNEGQAVIKVQDKSKDVSVDIFKDVRNEDYEPTYQHYLYTYEAVCTSIFDY